MMLELNLRIVGLLLLVLCGLNFLLPSRLRWREETARLSLLNRQIFYIHCFFIVLTIALCGTLLLAFAPVLLQPSLLARLILIGLLIFWSARLFVQLFVYDPSLWRGKRLETFLHLVFTATWSYFVIVFGLALFHLVRA